jgi:outer membrane protein
MMLLIFALLCSTWGFAKEPEPAPKHPVVSTHSAATHLSLDESVKEAVRNATGVLKSKNTDLLNGQAVLQSYGQFLPNLVLTGGYGYSTGTTLYAFSGLNIVDSKYLSAQYGISTTLNIFNGLADLSQLKAATERKRASELSLSWAKQQVAIDITQSYLQVTLDQHILQIAKKNLAASQARLKLFEGQAEVGAISTADLFRQQAQTASDEQYLINSETKLHDDQLIVIQKLRLETTANYILDEPSLAPENVPEIKQDEDLLITEALHAREDYRAQESILKATSWDVTRSESGYLPKIDLSFDRLASGRYLHTLIVNSADELPPLQQNLGAQLGNQVQWNLALTLTWNLFDRFVTRYNVEQSKIAEDNTRIDRDNLRLSVGAEIRQVIHDYRQAQRAVEAAETGLKAAVNAYKVIQGRYQVGSSSFIDVLATQSALVQSQASEAQSLINLKLQERLIRYFLGKYR